MIDELRKNLEQEKKIIEEMETVSSYLNDSDSEERNFYLSSLNSLKEQVRILNNAVPDLVGELSDGEKGKAKKKIVRMSYVSPSTKEKRFITINKEDKKKFIKELSFSESGLGKLRKAEKKKSVKPSKVAHVSNLVFGKFSDRFSGKFKGLKKDLNEANIRFGVSTYLSIALFFSLGVFVLSLAGFGILILIKISYLIWFWVPFALLGLCLTGFYLYPALEKGSVGKKLSNELPFATIYMAAIAGSNIEPAKIFKIIADSSEYHYVGIEMKKIVNQVEIYGYDLVSVLKNAAKKTLNRNLSELFSGMATNIVSGGSLKSFLEKKSENLLVDYKLKRQKYSSLAETFMDVYISILITAPLVLMMLFIVMNLTGFVVGLTMGMIMLLSIGAIVAINLIFMVVLQLKQPGV